MMVMHKFIVSDLARVCDYYFDAKKNKKRAVSAVIEKEKIKNKQKLKYFDEIFLHYYSNYSF